MQTTIRKWGNSLGLRIPKAFAEEAGVSAGSEIGSWRYPCRHREASSWGAS